MPMELSLEKAKELASEYLHRGYHCGPAVLQVMWEAYGFDNEDFLWAAIPFMGGISGHQRAPCGAVSASAIALGLRHRCPLSEKDKAKLGRKAARTYAAKLVGDFTEQFGDITCGGLLRRDFSKPGAYQEFLQSGHWKETCQTYVHFVIDKLFEFEEPKAVTE